MNDVAEPPEDHTVRLDATNLRGIAHPIRVKMLGILRGDGPATATGLAKRLDLNTGATSYHLRQLAEYGFVVEDTDRGVGRERWWKAAHYTTRYDAENLTEAAIETGTTYMRAVAQTNADQMLRAVDERSALPPAWRSAGAMNSYLFRLTPDELKRLNDDLEAVLRRYRSALPEAADAPADSARVTVQFQSFPHSTDLEFDEDRS